jgi:hypothetical protein
MRAGRLVPAPLVAPLDAPLDTPPGRLYRLFGSGRDLYSADRAYLDGFPGKPLTVWVMQSTGFPAMMIINVKCVGWSDGMDLTSDWQF